MGTTPQESQLGSPVNQPMDYEVTRGLPDQGIHPTSETTLSMRAVHISLLTGTPHPHPLHRLPTTDKQEDSSLSAPQVKVRVGLRLEQAGEQTYTLAGRGPFPTVLTSYSATFISQPKADVLNRPWPPRGQN